MLDITCTIVLDLNSARNRADVAHVINKKIFHNLTPGLNDAGSSGIQLKIIDHIRSNLTSTRVKTGFHNLKGTVGLGSSENGQSIKHEHVR